MTSLTSRNESDFWLWCLKQLARDPLELVPSARVNGKIPDIDFYQPGSQRGDMQSGAACDGHVLWVMNSLCIMTDVVTRKQGSWGQSGS